VSLRLPHTALQSAAWVACQRHKPLVSGSAWYPRLAASSGVGLIEVDDGRRAQSFEGSADVFEGGNSKLK
jgi:hypothetical protein